MLEYKKQKDFQKEVDIMKSKLILVILLLVLLLSGCSRKSEGLEFKLSDDKTYYTVIGIGTCEDSDIIIPKKYKN